MAGGSQVKVSNEDPDQMDLMKEYVWMNVRKQYISHIPMESIKELPDFYKVYLGGTAYAVMFAVFAYFTYTSYQSSTTVPFMSLTNGLGCESVSVNVSGTYQADSTGNWYGQQNFDYTKAVYSMQLSFVDGGQNQFYDALDTFQQDTYQLSSIGATASLPRNLLYWMVYTNSTQGGNNVDSAITFQFTGQANVVFNMDYVHGNVGSYAGICDIDAVASYDQGNSLFRLAYNYSQYAADSTCVGVMNPYVLGYFPTVNKEDFSLYVDVNAFAVAAGINYEIIGIDFLQQVPGEILTETLYGTFNVTFGEFFDPRTPLMDPVICITDLDPLIPLSSFPASIKALFERIDARPTCFLRFGGMPALPVFRHYGAEQSRPVACSCETGVGQTDACQEFNLLVSFVFYNVAGNATATSIQSLRDMSGAVLLQLLLLLNQTATYEDFNVAAYNASWAPISYVYPESAVLTNSKKWRKNAYQFCAINAPGLGMSYCSVLSLNPYSATSRSVSEYFYQLKYGSCYDTFSVNSTTWTLLKANPPAQFTQNYYECVMDTTDALMNAAGIAQGNVATVLPLLVIFTLPLMYIMLHLIGQTPPKEEYSFDEKKKALNAFAIQLLRMRDGKVRGMKHQGHLLGLGRELMAAAKLEGGYPDSDDSSDSKDSDDEEDEEGTDELGTPDNSPDRDSSGNIRESMVRARKAKLKSTKKLRFDEDLTSGYSNTDADNEYDTQDGKDNRGVRAPRFGDGHIIKTIFQRKHLDENGTGRRSEVRMSEAHRHSHGRRSSHHVTDKGKPHRNTVNTQVRRNNMDVFIR
jgi:hypothetical protein